MFLKWLLIDCLSTRQPVLVAGGWVLQDIHSFRQKPDIKEFRWLKSFENDALHRVNNISRKSALLRCRPDNVGDPAVAAARRSERR